MMGVAQADHAERIKAERIDKGSPRRPRDKRSAQEDAEEGESEKCAKIKWGQRR